MPEIQFETWTTDDLAGQCRMQARELLDPEHSAFMLAVSARLTALATAVARARREALEEGLTDDQVEALSRQLAVALLETAPMQSGKLDPLRRLRPIVRDLHAAIRALAATPPEARQTETGWPDISTAPRDGTWFLGIDDSASIRNVRWTRWWAPSGRTQEWLCHEAPGSWSPTRWNAGPTPPPPAIGNLEGELRS